jgi:hypothetical protein
MEMLCDQIVSMVRAACDRKPMMITNEVDANELAAWLGVTPTAVRDAARRGVLERTNTRRFALRASIQRYCAHLRRLVVERSTGPAAAARSRLLEEQAEHARVEERAPTGRAA